MIKEARGFGATVDEAKENAIANLQAAEDDEIQFEVIDTPKKKVLGLFGGRQAQVRVFVERPDPKPKKAPKSAQQKKKNSEKPTEKTAAADKRPAAKPQASEKAQPAEKPQAEEKSRYLSDFGEKVDASEIPADSKAGKAVAYLRSVLAPFGYNDLRITVAEKKDAALIELDGEDISAIVGRRGEVLDALQYLTSLTVNNGGGYFKITLNIGNFRERREETLASLAKRISEQVLKTGKSRTLEPMAPYERRIIHATVQNIEGVVSNSFGAGSARRVVISVEGAEVRPPRKNDNRRNSGNRRPSKAPTAPKPNAEREPKKDSDAPLYGKIG